VRVEWRPGAREAGKVDVAGGPRVHCVGGVENAERTIDIWRRHGATGTAVVAPCAHREDSGLIAGVPLGHARA
jgi:hypothetical protein